MALFSTSRINWKYLPPRGGKGQDLGYISTDAFSEILEKPLVDSAKLTLKAELTSLEYSASVQRHQDICYNDSSCLKVGGLMEEHRSHAMGPRPILDDVRAEGTSEIL